MNLLRPLGLAGIPCAAAARPGAPTLYSRFTRATLRWDEFSEDVEGLVEALVRFGAGQPEPPVLFYESDAQLLLVSRHRHRLATAFRFAVAEPDLVEGLVDKARFQALAERLGLPVPAARRLRPGAGLPPPDLDLRFPVIVKPFMRTRHWVEAGALGKALRVDTPAALREAWPRLAAMNTDLLAQEMIPGPENRIESYHVYVDRRGGIVADFTGRKIRTYPAAMGHSSALTITDEPDVAALGRNLARTLNLRGVAKFDFKRDPEGNLHLLEVNPRFNLWHFLGAVAGVNLPALVYADETGLARPAVARARAGVRWCNILSDFSAAREAGIPLWSWLPWALGCEAKSTVAWDDPLPILRGVWFQWSSRHAGTPRHGAHSDQGSRA